MTVEYTETALEEIEDILSYIAKDNPEAARRASIAILAVMDRIVEFPQTAVETDTVGVRVAPVLPYRYLVFYSIMGGTLIVRNVRHSARQRPDYSMP